MLPAMERRVHAGIFRGCLAVLNTLRGWHGQAPSRQREVEIAHEECARPGVPDRATRLPFLSWARRLVVLVAGGLAAGCATLPPVQQASLTQASESYMQGDLPGASSRVDHIINEYPNAAEIAEAYYIRGLCRTQQGQLQEAASDFEMAISKSQHQDLTARSQASLASVAYRQGDWSRAADLYQAALEKLPDQPPNDQVAFAGAVAMQRAGRWGDAAVAFSRIVRLYPNQPVAASAERLRGWPHQYFTIQLAVYSSSDAGAKAVQSSTLR